MTRTNRWLGYALTGLALAGVLSTDALAQTSFITFESGQVRPLVMSPDGTRLYAVNTPDNNLEIFSVSSSGLTKLSSISVGLEPVAVAARSNSEVWVVNHLSDSVSIVDVSVSPARVKRTLMVGDEPRDIVFAGSGNSRAFIATARRGQQLTNPTISAVPGAGDPKLTTPGEPRASVWVFDANNLGNVLGGTPLKIVNLFSDVPRALAKSPDGNTVYAAAFPSGNRTTVVNEGSVCQGFNPNQPCTLDGGVVYPGGNAGPATNFEGHQAPDVGIVVKFNPSSGHFEDELGRNWDNAIKFNLPDKDVFAINATTLSETAVYTGVGTTLFNMAVNPVSGKVYVSNTESINDVRFEGPGNFGGSTVQGHLAESRITVISGSSVSSRHLNKHINYNVLPASPSVKQHSLATPVDMVVSSNGATLYVAAFGSSKIGVFSTAALENNSFDPTLTSANYLSVTGGGPSGIALDEARNRLYVLTRFDNSVKVVNLATKAQIAAHTLNNPEPAHVKDGRRFLYDAQISSSNGEASCSSCHIFGDKDELGWDLGDPDSPVTTNPGGAAGDIRLGITAPLLRPNINGTGQTDKFHSMKGPMVTQTLRGMEFNGSMHWRGDRATGFFGTDTQQGPPFDADLAFRNFIVAFEGLNGREDIISAADMQKFADFALEIRLPPNPVRNLDNSLTSAQAAGKKFFFGCDGLDSNTALPVLCVNGRPLIDGASGHRSDGIPFLPELGFTCEGCHTTEQGNGFFGTDGRWSFEDLPQIVKIPQLRNMYTKVGMFGNPQVAEVNAGDNGHKGDQIRGFGFLHDGSVDTIFRFYNGKVFNCDPEDLNLVGFCGGNTQRRNAEQFMLAFDSDLPPVVGQQVTMTNTSRSDSNVNARVSLLEARCRATYASAIVGSGARECDLVAKAVVGGVGKTYRLISSGWYAGQYYENNTSTMRSSTYVRDRALTASQPVTWTAVPYGSGTRIAGDFQ
jgi:DNA-binding beta-propeller fold protein YncE